MIYFLFFSIFFNVFCTLGMMYFAYKIMMVDVTPRGTWVFKLAGVSIQAIQLVWSVFYVNDILTFTTTFPPMALLVSYTLGAARSLLLLVFCARVYYLLRLKFPVDL